MVDGTDGTEGFLRVGAVVAHPGSAAIVVLADIVLHRDMY